MSGQGLGMTLARLLSHIKVEMNCRGVGVQGGDGLWAIKSGLQSKSPLTEFKDLSSITSATDHRDEREARFGQS